MMAAKEPAGVGDLWVDPPPPTPPRKRVAPQRPKPPSPIMPGLDGGAFNEKGKQAHISPDARLALRNYLLDEKRELTEELANVFSDVLEGFVEGFNMQQACAMAGIKQSEYIIILAEHPHLNDRFEKAMEIILIGKCTEILGLIREARDTNESFSASGVKAALTGAERGVKMGQDMRERRLERTKASTTAKANNALFREVGSDAEGIDPKLMAKAKADSLKGGTIK